MSGCGEKLSWVVLAQGVSQGSDYWSQLSLEDPLPSSLTWFLAVLSFSPSGPLYRLLACSRFMTPGLPWSKWSDKGVPETDTVETEKKDRELSWSCSIFCNLMSNRYTVTSGIFSWSHRQPWNVGEFHTRVWILIGGDHWGTDWPPQVGIIIISDLQLRPWRHRWGTSFTRDHCE